MNKDQAILSINFTKPSGGVVKISAEGRRVTAQTQMVMAKETAAEEVSSKSEVKAELITGAGDDTRTFCCALPELELDASQDKQWKQIGSDPAGLRLQVKFERRTQGARAGFLVKDVR